MGGHEHGAALGSEPADQLDDVAALHRVEPVQRLVEQEQLGRVHERLGELDALSHALREAPDASFRGVLEPDGRERLGCGLARIGHVAQAGHELDQFARREEGPEAVAVVHDPDPPVDLGLAARIEPEHSDRAGAGIGEPGAQRERGGLAGAVVPEQAGHAGRQLERDLGQGDGVAIPLGDALEDERQTSALR